MVNVATGREKTTRYCRRTLLVALLAMGVLATASCQQLQDLDLRVLNPFRDNPDEAVLEFDIREGTSEDKTPTGEVNPAEPRFSELLKRASEKIAAAKDFHCVLIKREVIGDVLEREEKLDFTQRFEPHSLRLEWIGKRFKGRKLAFVKGANNDKVLVRLGTPLMRLKLLHFSTDSAIIRHYSRYTPDVAGYNNLLKRIVRVHAAAASAGKLSIAMSEPQRRNGRTVQRFELTFKYGLVDVDASRMIVWFDLGTSLPVRTIMHDRSGRVVEDYEWRGIELDRGLTDDDFKI